MNRIVILLIIYKRNIRKLVLRLVLCGVVSLREYHYMTIQTVHWDIRNQMRSGSVCGAAV